MEKILEIAFGSLAGFIGIIMLLTLMSTFTITLISNIFYYIAVMIRGWKQKGDDDKTIH